MCSDMDDKMKYRLIDFLDRHGCYPSFGPVQQMLLHLDEIGMTESELEQAIDEFEEMGVVVTAGRGGVMTAVVPGVCFRNGVHHVRLTSPPSR